MVWSSFVGGWFDIRNVLTAGIMSYITSTNGKLHVSLCVVL